MYDCYSECWELDEEVLRILLEEYFAEISENDYVYFRGIEKQKFLEILHKWRKENDDWGEENEE